MEAETFDEKVSRYEDSETYGPMPSLMPSRPPTLMLRHTESDRVLFRDTILLICLNQEKNWNSGLSRSFDGNSIDMMMAM